MSTDLNDIEPLVVALRRRAGVVGIAVVGSVARGAVRPGSDLDLVVLTEAGGAPRVEVFRHAGRPTEVLLMPEDRPRAELDDPRRGARTIATWAGGYVLHDTAGRLAALLAEIDDRHRRGPAPMSAEERAYARFELAHARGLIVEAAALPDPASQATCRLLIAAAVRTATDALLRHERRWPVGWRATLDALRALDRQAAARAERALIEPLPHAAKAATALIDHVLHHLGGPL